MEIYIDCQVCGGKASDFSRGWTGTGYDNVYDVLAYILDHKDCKEGDIQ